jgi:hypothetical protein
MCTPAAGSGTIERSKDLDTGEFLGPNRVWPGGLNMCRTIGDPQAPQVRFHCTTVTVQHNALQHRTEIGGVDLTSATVA